MISFTNSKLKELGCDKPDMVSVTAEGGFEVWCIIEI